MKQNIKIIRTISMLILLMTFSRCSNIGEQHDIANKKEATSKIEKTNEHPVTAEDSMKLFSNNLMVTGDIEHPLNLTVDSLKKMNVVTLDSLNIVCQTGAVIGHLKNSRAVLLKDILNKAVIKQYNHKDRNFYIVARATDGYKATFSWAEIFNNPTGENTYIVFEENNKPLTKKGAMMLNCNNDIKTGPRHVNWLKSIEINRVD
ncbi:MAG: molybdopterin-dependent oxidoreductase [Bacteroidota bacterium]